MSRSVLDWRIVTAGGGGVSIERAGSQQAGIAWQSQSLRVTAFPSPEAQVGEVSWWSELTGGQPDERTSRPKTGSLREQGAFERGRLGLSIEPERVDWVFAAVRPAGAEDEPLPVLGSFNDTLPLLMGVVDRWLDLADVPPIHRLAFGSVLVQPVENRATGYRLLADYLPSIAIDPDGSSDFLYQINRPRLSASGVPGLRINRLSKWSVSLTLGTKVTMGPPGLTVAISEGVSACRLELDVNTAPDYEGDLPKGRLAGVLHELAGMALEIAQRGDVA